jgi:predicted ATP-dependent endonuclease of OLD family
MTEEFIQKSFIECGIVTDGDQGTEALQSKLRAILHDQDPQVQEEASGLTDTEDEVTDEEEDEKEDEAE